LNIFPEVEGTNLDGREFVLPRDFEGKLNKEAQVVWHAQGSCDVEKAKNLWIVKINQYKYT